MMRIIIIMIIMIIISFFARFPRQFQMIVFHWSLRHSKSPPLSWPLLSILSDFNNGVVLMVSILLPVFNTSSLFSKILETISRAPTTVNIPVTLMFNNFHCSLARSKYLSIFSLSLFPLCNLPELQNPPESNFFLFLLIITWSGFGSRLDDPFISQYSRQFYESYSPELILVCAYIIWENVWISCFCTIPSGSSFLPSRAKFLEFFCASLLHLFLMW